MLAMVEILCEGIHQLGCIEEHFLHRIDQLADELSLLLLGKGMKTDPCLKENDTPLPYL